MTPYTDNTLPQDLYNVFNELNDEYVTDTASIIRTTIDVLQKYAQDKLGDELTTQYFWDCVGAPLRMPLKVIKKIIIEEMEPEWQSISIYLFRERWQHYRNLAIQDVEGIDTYEGINNYLIDVRGLSLQEWIDSL